MSKMICEKCGEKKSRKKPVLPFEDESGKNLQLCSECYGKLIKDEKKKLEYKGNVIIPASTRVVSGLMFGLAGAAGSGSGYSWGAHKGMEHVMKKNNLTLKMLDKKSIDLFDMHFWGCTEKQHNIVLKELGVVRKW